MNKQYLQAKVKMEGDKIVFIASDETLDRQGDVISLDSWDLKNFKKNPVLLVDHDYKVEKIVGTAVNIKIDKSVPALTFEPKFHEITPLSKTVSELVKLGELNTVSVGFMPVYPKKDGDKVKNELLEISFVAVPANPNATQMLSAEMLACVKSFVDESVEIEEKEGRVLSKKTRSMMVEAVSTMSKAIEQLNELLSVNDQEEGKSIKELENPTEEKEEEEKEEENPEEPDTDVIDSEKQETLTVEENKVEGKDPHSGDVVKEALKGIAHHVNDALHRLNNI